MRMHRTPWCLELKKTKATTQIDNRIKFTHLQGVLSNVMPPNTKPHNAPLSGVAATAAELRESIRASHAQTLKTTGQLIDSFEMLHSMLLPVITAGDAQDIASVPSHNHDGRYVCGVVWYTHTKTAQQQQQLSAVRRRRTRSARVYR